MHVAQIKRRPAASPARVILRGAAPDVGLVGPHGNRLMPADQNPSATKKIGYAPRRADRQH